MTQYFYEDPDINECKRFVIKNQAGANFFKELFLKIKIALTQSKYFESLFPTIKQQKPGLDLYAPMVLFQVLIIIFMIFLYTRMDPDYTNITSGDLTPTSFNATMVFAVFLQILIIVLDRYLYLSRDYVVIDEVEIEECDDEDSDVDIGRSESISQFDRVNTVDLRSNSASKLMVKGLEKNKLKMKGVFKESKNLDEAEDPAGEEEDDPGVQLSKTKFNKTLLLKYYLQLFMLVIIHIIVFWYFPIKANKDLQVTPFCQFKDPETGNSCNEVFMNWTLIIFYLMYCAYFTFSALQIRYGLPELRKGNFAMSGYGPANKGMFTGFMLTPFIFELKIFTDWTFTRTALDLFQWIKFEYIYGALFVAKCANKGIIAHPLGEKIPITSKALLGCGGLSVLIFIIAGPLLLFSTLNPLAEDNLVKGSSLRLNLIANLTDDKEGATNTYELFRTDRFQSVEPISEQNYKVISGERVVRNLDRKLFQQVQLVSVSDNVWGISPPVQEEIFERLKTIDETGSFGVNIELVYAFDRDEPAGQQTVDKALPILNLGEKKKPITGRKEIIQALLLALNPDEACDEEKDIS